MDAPPVQYVTSSDGYSIAYSVTGTGQPFVFMGGPLSHLRLEWRLDDTRAWCERLSERFQLIRYDSRGQGLSTRGLPKSHSVDDYVRDLEIVADHLKLERFILMAGGACHITAKYALKHPERLAALIFLGGWLTYGTGSSTSAILALARQDWDLFLYNFVARSLPPAQAQICYDMHRQSMTIDDWEVGSQAMWDSRIEDLLPMMATPTLVIHPTSDETFLPLETSTRFAQLANARLVVMEGNLRVPELESGFKAIDDFLASLPPAEPQPPAPSTSPGSLSARQAEVLRLIGEGRTNREIAEALVLSERTVERHVADVYAKIGAGNRAQAAVYAKEHGIV